MLGLIYLVVDGHGQTQWTPLGTAGMDGMDAAGYSGTWTDTDEHGQGGRVGQCWGCGQALQRSVADPTTEVVTTGPE